MSESDETLYERVAAEVRASPASFPDAAAISGTAGVGRRALDKLFREHGHESPDVFLRRVRMQVASHVADPEFRLRLPDGYRVREVLDFYARDPQSVSERVYPNGLDKALWIEGRPAAIEIRFDGGCANVRVDGGSASAAHRAVARMLGLDSDAGEFERRFARDRLLGALVRRQKGLRIPLTPEPWEALAWAIMGQQISLQIAVALRRELIMAFGEPHRSGLRAHPTAATVAALDVDTLRKLKFSRSKAEYLIGAARTVASGEIPLAILREISAQRAARMLGSVRGIGPWTIQYVFLRGFGFADCLPAGDAGLAQGLARLSGERPGEAKIREMMARYAPYRSFATYHVWASLKEAKGNAV